MASDLSHHKHIKHSQHAASCSSRHSSSGHLLLAATPPRACARAHGNITRAGTHAEHNAGCTAGRHTFDRLYAPSTSTVDQHQHANQHTATQSARPRLRGFRGLRAMCVDMCTYDRQGGQHYWRHIWRRKETRWVPQFRPSPCLPAQQLQLKVAVPGTRGRTPHSHM